MKPETEDFLMNDQPVNCPKCGARTYFKEVIQKSFKSPIQIHYCLDMTCKYIFQVVES